MGQIKSALEIALERTESVKSDKSGIEQFEARQRGKRLANEFLEGNASLEAGIKQCPKDQQAALKQGIFDVLTTQVSLPVVREDQKRLEMVGKGLQAIINDHRFSALYKQFTQAMTRYLDDAAQYGDAIKRQYAPKLRQKEEELARRLGRQVRLDPFQDPEFVAFYNQNMTSLKASYQDMADQVREQAAALFGSP
ncbi:MAG: hypothetical protein LBH70_02410 [Spirochaetaceae bacterium]|jgi:uncharacterized protein YukE|nr:hypothetical protein [Spirochaetaceae bacterium]